MPLWGCLSRRSWERLEHLLLSAKSNSGLLCAALLQAPILEILKLLAGNRLGCLHESTAYLTEPWLTLHKSIHALIGVAESYCMPATKGGLEAVEDDVLLVRDFELLGNLGLYGLFRFVGASWVEHVYNTLLALEKRVVEDLPHFDCDLGHR